MTRLSLILRSSLFAGGLIVATVLWSFVCLLSFPLAFPRRYYIVTRWNVFIRWWLKFTCKLDYELTGTEHIPAQPCIIFSKHESAWETIILAIHFAPQVWVLKRELLRLPFFGWGLAMLKPIAIDRGAGKSALLQVIEQGRQRLADRIWIVVYPEGTRVTPGSKRRYKIGGASLASATQVPVLPIAHNSGDYWPRNSFIKHPGHIRLVIGPLIETAGHSPAEINRLAETWIEGQLTALRPQAPAGPGPGALSTPGSPLR